MHWLVLFLLLGCQRTYDDPETVPAGGDDRVAYEAAVDRALTFLDKTGFVVTRHEGGQEKNQGDSLIFTGLLASVLPCDRGEAPVVALLTMPPELYRHPTLAGQGVSLDGALGLYLAAAARIHDCGEGARWKDFLAAHVAGGKPSIPPYFDSLRDRVAAYAAGDDVPSHVKELSLEVAGWALAVKASKAACYRINLGFMALRTLEIMGDSPPKAEFCEATKDTDLPTVDHWCGRISVKTYLDGYTANQWQYRHQRCQVWENPDGGGDDGQDEQPGIDYLVAWRLLHGA